MDIRLSQLLKTFPVAEPGIWQMKVKAGDQATELQIRDSVAAQALQFQDSQQYWDAIAQHHSVPVMRKLLSNWLDQLPNDALVIDIGVGWGWHWHEALLEHPRVSVAAIDFSLESLKVAKHFLPNEIETQIAFIQGDAADLNFPDEIFDGYWSTQCLQHVPEFSKAIHEAFRILKPGGGFINWSLNDARVVGALYRVLGKKYHRKGTSESWTFELNRWNKEQKEIIEHIFQAPITSCCSEVLFQPDLRTTGIANSAIGQSIDLLLSSDGFGPLLSPIARQRSFATKKPTSGAPESNL